MSTRVEPWPSIPDEDSSPFHYSSLMGCGALFAAPSDSFAALLPSGIVPATLSGRTYAALAYQRYHASYPTGDAVINELELSVLAVPAGHLDREVEVDEFLRGNDQTKQIGFFPLHVACDNDAAINPGITIFGEPKFKAGFTIETPSWNTHRPRSWSIAVADHPSGQPIMSLHVEAVHGAPAGLSPITTYSMRDERLIASRWQINNLTVAESRSAQARLPFINAGHPLGRTAAALIDAQNATAVWQHITPPVAVRYRPFYVDQPGTR